MASGRLGWAGAGGGFERWRSDAICLSNRLEGKARAPERGREGEEREAVGTGLGEGRGGVHRRYGVCVDRLMEE